MFPRLKMAGNVEKVGIIFHDAYPAFLDAWCGIRFNERVNVESALFDLEDKTNFNLGWYFRDWVILEQICKIIRKE